MRRGMLVAIPMQALESFRRNRTVQVGKSFVNQRHGLFLHNLKLELLQRLVVRIAQGPYEISTKVCFRRTPH